VRRAEQVRNKSRISLELVVLGIAFHEQNAVICVARLKSHVPSLVLQYLGLRCPGSIVLQRRAHATEPLSITFLGTFRITRDGSVVTGIESDKGRALLAYLATESGQAHRRESLAALLWPDADKATASQNFRRVIYNLRHTLEGEEGSVLLVTRHDIQFNSAAGHRVDVVVLSNLFDLITTHPHERVDACRVCIERLREAVNVYKGEFLASLSFLDSEPFDAWRRHKQEYLHARIIEALARLSAFHKGRREYADAIRYLRQQVRLEPWREEAHYQLMEVLARAGQPAAALLQFETCRHILADELGAEPSRATVALYKRIQSGGFTARSGRA
jgi:DNA-binding SARP family transcriptional activator